MRKIKITAIISIALLCLTCAVACAPKADALTPADFSNYTVTNMSAYELYKDLENTWINDTGCHRQDYFSFQAKDGVIASQQSLFESYRDGDKSLSRNIVLGTGFGKRCDMTTLYNDGENKYAYIVNDSKVVKNSKDKELTPFDKDFYTISDFGTFKTLDAWNNFANTEVKKDKRIKPIDWDKSFKHNFQHITTYDTSKKDYLSKNHDDKVYKKEDGTLIFRLTIDCSVDALNNIHTAARDEFLANTQAKKEGFKMIKDTTIEITAKKIGDTYKMTSWIRTEQYVGNHASYGFEIPCFQQSKCLISYDDYTITPEVIKTAIPA